MKNRRKPPSLAMPSQADAKYEIKNDGSMKEDGITIGMNGMSLSGGAKSGAKSGGAKGSGPRTGDWKKHIEKAESKDGEGIQLHELECLDILGQGTSGMVQRVRHKPTGRFMALKVVPLEVSPQQRKQILLELKVLHTVKCDQIIKFHGAFLQEGAISMALEIMEAGSLHTIMQKEKERAKPLDEIVLQKITKEVLTGFYYLHKTRKCVHRDIKPQNILVNKAGQIKLADFGMSGQMENSLDVKVSFVGTATYMAPERIRGDKYSFPSDIWSLGISLLELASGRFPYPAPSADGTVQPIMSFWDLLDIIQHEPVPTLPIGSGFSREFQDFIQQCVIKDPLDRPAADVLLKHEWMKDFARKEEDFDMAEYVRGLFPDIDTVAQGGLGADAK